MTMPRLGVDAFRWRPGSTVGYLLGVVNADGTIEPVSAGSLGLPGEVLVEDGALELLFDDATGDVLHEG